MLRWEVSPNAKSRVHTRSIQPLRIAGKLQKWTGAMNASPSAQATFSCWASTSLGMRLRISAAMPAGDLPRSARAAAQRWTGPRQEFITCPRGS